MPKGARHYGGRNCSMIEPGEIVLKLLPRQRKLLREWLLLAQGNSLQDNGNYSGMSLKSSQEIQQILDSLNTSLSA